MQYSDKCFGRALEDIIKQKQVKLRSLAKKTNLDFSYFSKLKKKSNPPPLKTIEVIAKGLGIDPGYFLEYRIFRLNQLLYKNPSITNDVLAYAQKISHRKKLKVADHKNSFTKPKK